MTTVPRKLLSRAVQLFALYLEALEVLSSFRRYNWIIMSSVKITRIATRNRYCRRIQSIVSLRGEKEEGNFFNLIWVIGCKASRSFCCCEESSCRFRLSWRSMIYQFLAFHQFSCRFPERDSKPLRNNKHIFVFAIIHQDHCGILTAASSFLSNYFSIFTQWLEFCGGWTNKKNIGTRTMSDTAENRNLTYFPSSPDLPGKPARTIEHCTTIENE